MYTLISKEGNVRRIIDKESKRDELLRMGYRLVKDTEQEPEQGEPKPRKRTSQSTAAKKADADKE